MSDTPTGKTPRGPLRALTDWLKGGTPPPHSASGSTTPAPESLPARIGHYAIVRKLGQGGMGIVYAARDERLERTVALKTMALPGDEAGRKRFWREARAAASVNHPNVCQLYEIGEDRGELFIAMELLEGESLAERLERGPFSVAEALPVGLGILAALAALHAREVVHRDLKPSNVFLTPHGVKLLDFGLARTLESDATLTLDSGADLTHAGMIVGTPRYMAPEQATGEGANARSDLFATGAILFEMLAGRPAFIGRNVLEILHATVNEQPPALTGSPGVAAVDRVIRRALAKRSEERTPSAEAMAAELRAVLSAPGGDDAPALAHTLTRLVVLPFRILRPDPETDFLAFSLSDAIATSLSRFGSLIVRSSATAGRFGGDSPDLRVLASEADVDRVVMGTLLRNGDRLRATAQLVEAPAGTLLRSETIESSLGDLFRLQDDIAGRVVEALALPLAAGGATPTPDAPRDGGAYGLYLRANELSRSYEKMSEARDLYRRCLDLDPSFAPAWAQLGRSLWVIGKYVHDRGDTVAQAEEAYRRALALNPRLPLAHKYYANLEADTGHADRALVRLLGEAARRNDPELFSGLVHACRYSGLNEQSVAAHDEARRLDPNVPTSVEQTLLMAGDLERLLVAVRPKGLAGGDDMIRVIGLGLAGRRDEARERIHVMRQGHTARITAFQTWTDFLLAWLDRRIPDMIAIRAQLGSLGIMEDPEAIFQEAWLYSDAGDSARGLELARRAVDRGYFVHQTLAEARAFDAVRGEAAFQKLLADAAAGRDRALAAFRAGGGERLLG